MHSTLNNVLLVLFNGTKLSCNEKAVDSVLKKYCLYRGMVDVQAY